MKHQNNVKVVMNLNARAILVLANCHMLLKITLQMCLPNIYNTKYTHKPNTHVA
jgi:hypothetical protein